MSARPTRAPAAEDDVPAALAAPAELRILASATASEPPTGCVGASSRARLSAATAFDSLTLRASYVFCLL
jgi:hypothetical protein